MFALLVLLNSLLRSFPIVLQPHHPMHALVEFDYCIKAGHHWYHNVCSPCAITAKYKETSAGYDACHPFVLGVYPTWAWGTVLALRGLHHWEKLLHFYEFQGSVALGLVLRGHAGGSLPYPFHCLLVCILMPPLLVSARVFPFHCLLVCILMPPLLVSARVFKSFCLLGCCHLWNVGQLYDGGSVPFWIIPVEHYLQLHLDGLHTAS